MMMTNRNSNQNSKRHLFIYMTALIQQFRANGHIRTAETYQATLNSFRKFRGESDIPLHKINAEIIEAYEAFLNAASLSPNTVSIYMRILRATYNRAVEQELAKQTFPFRRVYTGNEKTRKRALPIAKLKQLKTIDISRHKSLDFARDMFMLSFYMRGMSFIDMAFLKKKISPTATSPIAEERQDRNSPSAGQVRCKEYSTATPKTIQNIFYRSLLRNPLTKGASTATQATI